VLRNSFTEEWETSGREVQRFPYQAVAAMQEGVFHLGGDEHTDGVDPERECYPAGQGVGGIDALEPAGDIVRRVVEEAEAVLAGLAPTRV
jgi:enoyl-[acyl-carrier protein] reductase II